MNKKLKTFAFTGLLIALVLIASSISYEDEVADERHYIEMVCSGAWPDFKNLNPEC